MIKQQKIDLSNPEGVWVCESALCVPGALPLLLSMDPGYTTISAPHPISSVTQGNKTVSALKELKAQWMRWVIKQAV